MEKCHYFPHGRYLYFRITANRGILSFCLPRSQATPEHMWIKSCSVYWERDGGTERGRREDHWICGTGGDVKLEVRNNWCNAGEWRRGVRPLQCFALGEHQSRAHSTAISAVRLQWDPIFREQEGHEPALQHCTLLTAQCTSIIHSYYWPHVCIAVNTIILYSVLPSSCDPAAAFISTLQVRQPFSTEPIMLKCDTRKSPLQLSNADCLKHDPLYVQYSVYVQ